MNDNPRASGSRGHDPYAALRLVALIAAITGVIVLAAAAFVLSYGGIHKIALSAGVSASMARIFPVVFDATLVVSCAAVLSLRAAHWWPRTYAWLTTLVLLAVVAAADAVHATGTHIPRKPAAATIAVLPWALLLLAFSLLLSMLRQFRRTRAAAASQGATDTAAPDFPVPGSTVPGSTVPGSTVPGSTVPGTALAGNAVPGNAEPGAAPTGAAARPGLDILERRGPAHSRRRRGLLRPGLLRPGLLRPGLLRPGPLRPGPLRPGPLRPGPLTPGPRPSPAPCNRPAPWSAPSRPGRAVRPPGPVPPLRPMARAALPLKSSRNEHLSRPPSLPEVRSRRPTHRPGQGPPPLPRLPGRSRPTPRPPALLACRAGWRSARWGHSR